MRPPWQRANEISHTFVTGAAAGNTPIGASGQSAGRSATRERPAQPDLHTRPTRFFTAPAGPQCRATRE